jgi:S1-C subfamily serine protease
MPRGEGRLLPPDGFNFDEMERVTGAAVLEVVPDSAADAAGLLVGDVIQAVDGTQLKSFDELAAAVRALSPGDTLTLTVWRDGAAVDVVVTLGARADDVTAPYLGVRIGPFFQLDQPAEEDDGFRFRSPFGDGSFSPRDFFDRFREMFPNAENDPNA